jgi:HEPN domain-containing protein
MINKELLETKNVWLNLQEYEKWLRIAKENLLAAKIALSNKLFSPAMDECQQCAEKALKGYLAFKRHEMVETPDLIKLIGLCIKFDSSFEEVCAAADLLNPFVIKFRDSTKLCIASFAEAESSIKYAQQILNFVLKKISEPETGQGDIFRLK